MRLREDSLLEIYTRIKDNKDALGLTTFKRSPTTPVKQVNLPCILMVEGEDTVVKPSKRTPFGYPKIRNLEITLEMITDTDYNIKKLYRDVRSTVLGSSIKVAENCFIEELRAEGPTGYGLPNVLGMRLVLMLTYADLGD